MSDMFRESLCQLADMFRSPLPFAGLLLCSGLAMLCYIGLWLLLRFRLLLSPIFSASSSQQPSSTSTSQQDFNTRISRSLSLLLLSLASGWTFMAACRWLLPLFNVDGEQRLTVAWVYTLLLDLAGMSNLFILYVSRQVFDSTLCFEIINIGLDNSSY